MRYSPNKFRTYSEADVKKLQGSYKIDYTIAKLGADRLWSLFNTEPYVKALGAYTGSQAVQMVRAGLQSIYLSGWQVAGDGQSQTYPDQSLYPVDAVPKIVERINNALLRADQIEVAEFGKAKRDWLVPIIADAEGGGGILNAYELMKSMIVSGAAGVHFEDQNSISKKCGHLSGKVLVPTKSFVKTLIAARLAADVCNTNTVLIARTDADSASLITSDHDEYDAPFIDKSQRTDDGFYKLIGDPMERCVARGLAYAPYCDMIWMETNSPSIKQAAEFAAGIHEKYPNKMLTYNLSPSFNWKKNLSDKEIAEFQDELGKLGMHFQFVTLASFHSNSISSYKLAHGYKEKGMPAYVELQEEEFEWQKKGYTAVKHQREVGTEYFDKINQIISGNDDLSALKDSTEKHQF